MSAVSLDTNSVFLTAALILQSVSYVVGITCYKCTIRPPPMTNQTSRLCSKFDHSRKYEVDCPYSTFCMKKTFNLPLQNEKSVQISIRDCAPQKHMYQVYTDGRWKMEEAVQEDIYTSGCHDTDNSAGLKTSTETYCYCSSHLCNKGQNTKDSSTHTDIMTVIFVFNAMKYIRSIR